jgi:tight adherence protein B
VSVAAGIATALAVWVAHPDDGLLLRVRLGGSSGPISRPSPTVILVTVLGVAVVAAHSATTQLALLAAGSAVAFGLALRRRASDRRHAREFRADTATFLRAWSAELRSGLAPVDAARRAADEAAIWDPMRVAAAADVPDALLAIAAEAGGEALVDAAAAWSIADATGAPLADVLVRVSDAV